MAVMQQIQAEVDRYPLVLFMKGTPQYPMCGFSSRAVQALMAAGAVALRTVNVLEEPEIRANLPRFSNLPTFPQLFINGELIGGCGSNRRGTAQPAAGPGNQHHAVLQRAAIERPVSR